MWMKKQKISLNQNIWVTPPNLGGFGFYIPLYFWITFQFSKHFHICDRIWAFNLIYYRNNCFAHLSFLRCIRKIVYIYFSTLPKSVWSLRFPWLQRNEASFLFDNNSNSELNGPSKSLWKQMKIEGFGRKKDSCDKIESLVRELERKNKLLWWSDGALGIWWERNAFAKQKQVNGLS